MIFFHLVLHYIITDKLSLKLESSSYIQYCYALIFFYILKRIENSSSLKDLDIWSEIIIFSKYFITLIISMKSSVTKLINTWDENWLSYIYTCFMSKCSFILFHRTMILYYISLSHITIKSSVIIFNIIVI